MKTLEQEIEEIILKYQELGETCPECEGGGFVAKLLPSGHAEVKCEICCGRGYL